MFIFLIILVFVSYFLYLRIYFKPLTFLECRSDNTVRTISIKPSKVFFKSVSGFVHLGDSYYSTFLTSDMIDLDNVVDFNSVFLGDSIIIFRRSRFGRFKSVSLSDRVLFDILKKI